MARIKNYGDEWKGKLTNTNFDNTLFEELRIKNARLEKLRFSNVHFKNCYLGFDTKYSNCQLVDCKFYGKYSSLGTSTNYINCEFLNCEFVGVELFNGQYYKECSFSGSMKNMILRDYSTKGTEGTQFDNCDLSNILFDTINIYGRNIFKNCKLPSKGIRLFDNTNDRLIQKADRICQKITSDEKLETEIIFKKSLKLGQNPIILDVLFLNSFFKTEESRNIFENVIQGSEIN